VSPCRHRGRPLPIRPTAPSRFCVRRRRHENAAMGRLAPDGCLVARRSTAAAAATCLGSHGTCPPRRTPRRRLGAAPEPGLCAHGALVCACCVGRRPGLGRRLRLRLRRRPLLIDSARSICTRSTWDGARLAHQRYQRQWLLLTEQDGSACWPGSQIAASAARAAERGLARLRRRADAARGRRAPGGSAARRTGSARTAAAQPARARRRPRAQAYAPVPTANAARGACR